MTQQVTRSGLNLNLSRRGFLARGAAGLGMAAVAAVAAGLPTAAFAQAALRDGPVQQSYRNMPVRSLSFHNLHTDEKLQLIYWTDGQYETSSLDQINHILRDHYTGDEHTMDVGLIDMLHDVQNLVENDRPIQIISGYRSPTTNNRLREAKGDPACTGVAKNSFHMRGMATDLRFDGTPLARLHDIALDMRRGGVGYYPSSNFVHMDVGPVRRWG